ncbi:hypothetical protein KI387_019115, partial [Taxus chinensis]
RIVRLFQGSGKTKVFGRKKRSALMAYEVGSGFTTPNLDDGELWLPSGFLGDVTETKNYTSTGPSETEEENDYMAGLAQRVAYAMLEDDDNDENCERNGGFRGGAKWVPEQRAFTQQAAFKGCGMARSPQSTLAGLERWSAENDSIAKENAWALFNMAAEQVVRLEQGRRSCVGANLVPSKMLPSHDAFSSRKRVSNGTAELYGVESVYNGLQQMQAQRVSNPRPYVEVAKGNAQTKAASRCVSNSRPVNRQSMVSAPGHMDGGSGMRAVFLGSNGPGRESGGTGFFLPRRMDNKGYAAKPQPKPACSTVLLPARIVQALNLNVEELRTSPYVYVRKNEKRRSVGGDSWQQPQQQQQRAGHNT